MKIKIHSAEINRMMKTISQCIDPRIGSFGNIEIIYDNNLLTIRGTNGQVNAIVCTPMLGGDGEVFCVDGTMFARVCSTCSGELEISTDGKNCIIKGAGRTRLPIINANVPTYNPVNGSSVEIVSDDLARCFRGVSYAISEDQSRIQLTGVLTEVEDNKMKMITLDGFQLSTGVAHCTGDNMRVTIPGSFMKLIISGTSSCEDVTIRTDGTRIEAKSDSMRIVSGLLAGDYPDYRRILPTEFKTECLVNVEGFRSALKMGSVISNKNNLIKVDICEDSMKIMSNNESADYDADIPCVTNGNGLTIAFDQRYLLNTVSTITSEKAVLKFNSSVSPCVVQGKDEDGVHLVLPVRIAG